MTRNTCLRTPFLALLLSLAVLVTAGCSAGAPSDTASATPAPAPAPAQRTEPAATDARTDEEETTVNDAAETAPAQGSPQTATFGAGCFWCVEAVLEQLDGVVAVRSGYMGGDVENPTYRAVCSGETGHAEVVQVDFDPAQISYETLLDWFFRLHDPTTLNRQGADVGTQYRSVIFWHSDGQRAAAEKVKAAVAASGAFSDPIVTEISAAGPFYEAEDYHQDYYRNNTSAGYCRVVIRPKLDKLGLDTLDKR